MAPPTSSPDRLAVILALGSLGGLLWRHRRFVHDDAFIALRYAENLALTGLPQWNPGEWTEGYTSPLHVLALAACIALGIGPVQAARMLGVAGAVALVGQVASAARRLAPADPFARAAAVLGVGLATPLAVWSLGGLEAVPLAALLAAGSAALVGHLEDPRPRRIAWAATVFAAAVMIRLDAAVFVTVAAVGLAWAGPGAPARRLRDALWVVGLPAAVAFAWMGVRVALYGELLPLTFHAKVSLPLAERLPSGLAYAALGGALLPWLPAAFGVAPLARHVAPVRVLGPALAAHAIYVIWVGGDHMPAGRMWVPILGPAAMVWVAALATLRRPVARALAGGVLVLGGVAAVAVPTATMDGAAFVGGLVGRHIRDHWPPGLTVALNTAGSTPFYAGPGVRFVDMLGLNDPVIAKRADVPFRTPAQRWPGHAKGDGAYVLARAPDRIVLGPAEGVDVDHGWFLSDVELRELPAFHQCYEKVVEAIPYDAVTAELGPVRPNPLTFTWYRRTCGAP